jgi:hypothetical protein
MLCQDTVAPVAYAADHLHAAGSMRCPSVFLRELLHRLRRKVESLTEVATPLVELLAMRMT